MHTEIENSPTIVSFSTSRTFGYLWLKYITGFDLSVHCARCLIGAYSRHFKFGSKSRSYANLRLDEAKAQYYYLCGVTAPFVWRDNLHVAFRFKKGSRVEYNDGNTTIVIEDAEQIEIKMLPSYDQEAGGEDRAYNTCRNWRFAYQIIHGS